MRFQIVHVGQARLQVVVICSIAFGVEPGVLVTKGGHCVRLFYCRQRQPTRRCDFPASGLCSVSVRRNGEGGIRTRGTRKGHTDFRNRLLKPLGHLSGSVLSVAVSKTIYH